VVATFLEVLSELDARDQRRFLRFVTGDDYCYKPTIL
jgi:hypothetical protein